MENGVAITFQARSLISATPTRQAIAQQPTGIQKAIACLKRYY